MIATLWSQVNKRPAVTAALIGIALVAVAMFNQYGLGYAPCELCWWQRYPYLIMAIVLPVAIATKKANSLAFLALITLLFAVDAGIAGFHVGVEQKWWEGFASCSSTLDLSGSAEDALNAIMSAALVKCDAIVWQVLGISMAGWNFLIALATTVFCATHLRSKKKG